MTAAAAPVAKVDFTPPSESQRPYRGTVLAVDDRPHNVNILLETLGAEGYEVIPASSGEAALECLASRIPDLILLDVMMPGIDGFETCRRIHRDPRTAGVAVIFLSANNNQESIVQGFAAGGIDYVTKPFNRAELLARVGTQVAMKRLQDRNRSLMQGCGRLVARALDDLKRPLHAIADSLNELGGLGQTDPARADLLISQAMAVTRGALGSLYQEGTADDMDFREEITTESPVSSTQVEAMIHSWHLRSRWRSATLKVSRLPAEMQIEAHFSQLTYLVDLLMAETVNSAFPGDTIHARLHADEGRLVMTVECHGAEAETTWCPTSTTEAEWFPLSAPSTELVDETHRVGGTLSVQHGICGGRAVVLTLPLYQ